MKKVITYSTYEVEDFVVHCDESEVTLDVQGQSFEYRYKDLFALRDLLVDICADIEKGSAK